MTEQELQKMVDTAVNALEDIKAKDITVLDTSAKTSLHWWTQTIWWYT